jgi:hypothetical protein
VPRGHYGSRRRFARCLTRLISAAPAVRCGTANKNDEGRGSAAQSEEKRRDEARVCQQEIIVMPPVPDVRGRQMPAPFDPTDPAGRAVRSAARRRITHVSCFGLAEDLEWRPPPRRRRAALSAESSAFDARRGSRCSIPRLPFEPPGGGVPKSGTAKPRLGSADTACPPSTPGQPARGRPRRGSAHPRHERPPHTSLCCPDAGAASGVTA